MRTNSYKSGMSTFRKDVITLRALRFLEQPHNHHKGKKKKSLSFYTIYDKSVNQGAGLGAQKSPLVLYSCKKIIPAVWFRPPHFLQHPFAGSTWPWHSAELSHSFQELQVLLGTKPTVGLYTGVITECDHGTNSRQPAWRQTHSSGGQQASKSSEVWPREGALRPPLLPTFSRTGLEQPSSAQATSTSLPPAPVRGWPHGARQGHGSTSKALPAVRRAWEPNPAANHWAKVWPDLTRTPSPRGHVLAQRLSPLSTCRGKEA